MKRVRLKINSRFLFLLFLQLLLAQALLSVARPSSAECITNGRPIQGVGTHFGFWNAPLGDVNKIKQTGFSSLRDEAFWSRVEATDGTLRIPAHVETYVNAAIAAGIQPVLLLGYGHPNYDNGGKPLSDKARAGWKRYAQFVVQHFKGRVQTYELWNEWDIAIGGTQAGQPEDLARLVTEVAPALRSIDPSACLIAGAVTAEALKNGWLIRAIRAGLLTQVDALSIHTYNYRHPDKNKRTPEAWYINMLSVQKTLRQEPLYGDKPLYVTEMGWSSYAGNFGLTPELQAAYLQRLYLWANGNTPQKRHQIKVEF